MKRKRIMAISTVIFICATLISVSVLGDDVRSWRQKADNSEADVIFSGRVAWADKNIVPNVVTYHASLVGSDIEAYTYHDAATLVIKSGIVNRIIVNEMFYYGHNIINSTSKSTTASSIIVNWTFDGYKDEYNMK